MMHIRGIRHKAADAVSRHPTGSPEKLVLSDDVASINDHSLVENIPSFTSVGRSFLSGIRVMETTPCDSIDTAIQLTAASSLNQLKVVSWDRVRHATSSDSAMTALIDIIESGMPELRHEMPPEIRIYHQFREDLYTVAVDGVVLYKERIAIPKALQHDILLALHLPHQSVAAMTSRAETSVYWPGITADIAYVRAQCRQMLQQDGTFSTKCSANTDSKPT